MIEENKNLILTSPSRGVLQESKLSPPPQPTVYLSNPTKRKTTQTSPTKKEDIKNYILNKCNSVHESTLESVLSHSQASTSVVMSSVSNETQSDYTDSEDYSSESVSVQF